MNTVNALVNGLPALPPGSALEREWNTFRSELPRLLAEGLEGHWVLIKGERILGVAV